jgi:hypothetical protein
MQQAKRGPCYIILRFDRKTYCIEFDLEMFINRWYNWKGAYDVNVNYNGSNKQEKKKDIERKALKWVKANNVPPRESL